MLFFLVNILFYKVTIKRIITFIKYVLFFIISFILIYIFFEPTLSRFIYIFFEHDIVAEINNNEASGGVRLLIWKNILDFVLINPFTGTGFLGVWGIQPVGSSHNQYMDLLLRTGFIYFLIFMLVIVKLCFMLFKYERYMFFGFMAFLIYGMFHETFKESQGAFVLAFLFGWMADKIRTNKIKGRYV